MRLTKPILGATLLGVAMFAASSALAVPGVLTVSGTALTQSTNTKGDYVSKKHNFTQKDVLFLLAQATGYASITNSPTKLYYDPDTINTNALDSIQAYDFYGVFYCSNSVDGRIPLDGIDGSGDYYSYIEFDYYNGLLWDIDDVNVEGFWQPGAVEYNTILAEGNNKGTGYGNGILYIHSDPYYYNLPNNYAGGDGYPPHYYYANDYFGLYQDYAIVIHGALQFGASLNSSGTTEKEAIKLSGSGDGVWDDNTIVVNGKVKFNGTGPEDLF